MRSVMQVAAVRAAAALAVCSLLLQVNPGSPVQASEYSQTAEPFVILANRSTTEQALDRAIAQLDLPPKEPARFWSQIANDADYPRFQRQRAVIQLFRRHVRVGMRVSQLAQLLDHSTWLRAMDVKDFVFVSGLRSGHLR